MADRRVCKSAERDGSARPCFNRSPSSVLTRRSTDDDDDDDDTTTRGLFPGRFAFYSLDGFSTAQRPSMPRLWTRGEARNNTASQSPLRLRTQVEIISAARSIY